MFSEKKKSNGKNQDYSKEQNKIAKGSVLSGDIESEGSFRIEGKLEGTLKTPGKVVVGETGFIDGEVECGDADFEGKFNGTLKVKNNLILKSTCNIEGQVSTGRLSVEPGATLNGSCSMNGSVKSLNDERKGKQEAEKTA